MKKQIIMAAALVMISASVALAQEGKAPATNRDQAPRTEQTKERGQRMEQMKTELGLTEDQVAKIRAIHQASKVKPETPKAEMTAEQKEALKKAREEERAKIRAVLTPEQQVKFDQMKNERPKQKRMQQGAKK